MQSRYLCAITTKPVLKVTKHGGRVGMGAGGGCEDQTARTPGGKLTDAANDFSEKVFSIMLKSHSPDSEYL